MEEKRCELTCDDINIRHVHGAEVDDVGTLFKGESEDVLLGGGAAQSVDADDILFTKFVTRSAKLCTLRNRRANFDRLIDSVLFTILVSYQAASLHLVDAAPH